MTATMSYVCCQKYAAQDLSHVVVLVVYLFM